MRYTICCIFFILNFIQLSAQKKLIDNSSYKSWESLQGYGLSDDGAFAWYSYGSLLTGTSLVIKEISGSWVYKVSNANTVVFNKSSKFFLFKRTDSLFVGSTITKAVKGFPADEFGLPKGSNCDCFFYKKGEILILKKLDSDEELILGPISNYWLNADVMYFQNKDGLYKVELSTGRKLLISHLKTINDIAFDSKSTSLAYISEINGEKVVCEYKNGEDSSRIILMSSSPNIDSVYEISDITPWYADRGGIFFIKLAQRKLPKIIDTSVVSANVDIWHYEDDYLQSQQVPNPDFKTSLLFTVAIKKGNKILQVEDERYRLVSDTKNSFVILKSNTIEYEAYWNPKQRPHYKLLNLFSEQYVDFFSDSTQSPGPTLSPAESYITWKDTSSQKIICYDIKTHTTDTIGKDIHLELKKKWEYVKGLTLVGWIADEKKVILSDYYDLWLVDPKGVQASIDLTQSYGKTNRIRFYPAMQIDDIQLIKENHTLLLACLDDSTKQNGFFQVRLSKKPALTQCSLNSFSIFFPGLFNPQPPTPIKAANKNVFVMIRQSATEAPNVTITSDFKDFRVVSDLCPQKQYNWMTATIVNWKSYDDQVLSGILYKPENFDITKKYPLIFNFYEIRSNEFGQFRAPELSGGTLDIAWYVSNGYCVFLPDIYKEQGKIGLKALLSVTSAARYLIGKYPWIDSTKLGLQGHSYGGYETNFIITRSDMFAAAQSSAGLSDLLAEFGDVGFGGGSLTSFCEIGHMILGTTPWQGFNVYKENSPIFYADKINTPLLLQHNKGDMAVPFSQSLSLYNWLRRLKKPVWLLQYDWQDHILNGESNANLDFSIRQQQFFDYYLKGKGIPEWMIRGIPSNLKGKDSGFNINK
jgi:dienelactone hydrolase